LETGRSSTAGWGRRRPGWESWRAPRRANPSQKSASRAEHGERGELLTREPIARGLETLPLPFRSSPEKCQAGRVLNYALLFDRQLRAKQDWQQVIEAADGAP